MGNPTLEIIREILKGFEYDRCLLYGSQARGDATPGSDYDLMIIIHREMSIPDRMTMATHIRKLLALKFINADVVVKPASEVESHRNFAGSLIRNVMLEGVSI